MSGLSSVVNTLTMACKGLQLVLDASDLSAGVVEFLEPHPEGNSHIAKVISGATRLVFSGMEVGAKLGNASNKTMSGLKIGEMIAFSTIVVPMEAAVAIEDVSHGRINGIQGIAKVIAPIASITRAGVEQSIYQERHYLGLSPEELAKERRSVPKPGTNPEYPEFEEKPVIVEECKKNLRKSEKAFPFVSTVESALRASTLNKTIDLYQQLALRLRAPSVLQDSNALLAEDPFDLLRLRTIPIELHHDVVFNRYKCPLTHVPVRDPVGDPTLTDSPGHLMSPVFERHVMVNWIRQKGFSPNTRKPLAIHQLVRKPHLRALIDHRLQFHSDRLRAFAAIPVIGNPPSPVLAASALSTSIAPSTEHMCAEWTLDSKPICTAVYAAIGQTEQKPIGLLLPLVEVVVSYLKANNGCIFGAREWETLFGKVGPAPVLPLNIENIWQSQCLAFPGKKVHETHMLVYIPTTVDEKILTLKSLGEIAKRHFSTIDAGYGYIWDPIVAELGNMAIEKSCWVLMTKDVLPESRGKNYANQQTMMDALAKKAFATYEIPGTLEAAVCLLAQYFGSQTTSKTHAFGDNPWTSTHCQEKVQGVNVVVGGFHPALGNFIRIKYGNHLIGVAALRRF